MNHKKTNVKEFIRSLVGAITAVYKPAGYGVKAERHIDPPRNCELVHILINGQIFSVSIVEITPADHASNYEPEHWEVVE